MNTTTSQIMNELVELRECVNQSSAHTKRQIDVIEKNAYILGIVTLIVSLGASYYLEIINYWIPAGFMLMYLWGFFSIKGSKKHFEKKTIDKGIEIYNKTNKEVVEHSVITNFKNMSSMIKSATIIYIISTLIIFAFQMNWIQNQIEFEIFFPLVTCVYYVSAPYFLDKTIKMFEERGYQKFLDNFIHYRKISKNKKISKLTVAVGIVIFIYLFFALLLPIISFFQTMSLIENWFLLFIILFFQLILMFLFSNYFSALTVKKELSNSITNFADINYLINESLLDKKTERIQLETFKKLYLTAKPYDYVSITLFKFIPFYYLIPNRVFLSYKSKKGK